MATVIERLIGMSPDGKMEADDCERTQRYAADLARQGWTDDEIVSKMKWIEHINPYAHEDVALRMMKAVDDRVAARLASIKS